MRHQKRTEGRPVSGFHGETDTRQESEIYCFNYIRARGGGGGEGEGGGGGRSLDLD